MFTKTGDREIKDIKSLPTIPLDEFEDKVMELGKKLFLVKNLCKKRGDWEKLPPHLLDELFVRIGARPVINKY